MANPNKNFGLEFQKEIARLDQRVVDLLDRRRRLVKGYRAVTGDYSALVRPAWLANLEEEIAKLEEITSEADEEDTFPLPEQSRKRSAADSRETSARSRSHRAVL